MYVGALSKKDISALGLVIFAVSCWFSADSNDAYICDAPTGVIDAPSETCQEGKIIYHGGICTTLCLSGFIPSVATLSCLYGVLNPSTFECIGDPCSFVGTASIPYAPIPVDRQCKEGAYISHRSSCTTQCLYGYEPSVPSLSCYASYLTPPTYTCIGQPCTVPNASNTDGPPCLEGYVIDHGSRCTPNCLPGYATPVKSLLCIATTLNPPDFECTEAPCQAPVVENAAAISCAGGGEVQHGDKCFTQCLQGYYPSIDALNCSLGELAPRTFECLPSPCEAPSGIKDSAAQTCKEGAMLDHGSFCTAQCAEGYEPTVETLNCSLGELDPPTFSCMPARCQVPTGIEYAASPPCSEGFMIEHDEGCTPQCIFGYVPTIGYINCSFGVLDPKRFHCVGAPCPSPEEIAFTKTPTCNTGFEVPHGGFCIPQCQSGFLPSVQNLSCQFYLLTPPTYECLEAPCVAPGSGHPDECESQRVSEVFTVNTGVTWHLALASLGGSTAIVCFQDNDQGQVGRCGVISVDDPSLLPANTLQVHPGVTTDFQLATLSSSRALVCYRLHHSDYRTESLCDILDISSDQMLTHHTGSRHNSGAAVWRYTAAQLAPDKALVCYQEQASSKCVVLGVPVQVPTAIVLSTGSSSSLAAAALSTDRALVCFSDVQRGEFGICTLLTSSGRTLAKGADHIVASESVAYLALAPLSSDEVIMCYSDWSQSEHGRCQVITASAAQLSWTLATIIEHHVYKDHRLMPGTTRYLSLAAISSTRAVACFQLAISAQERYGYCKVLSSTGTGLTQGADLVLNPATTWNVASAKLDQGRVVVCFSDTSKSERGSCNVLQPGSEHENWRGADTYT